MRPGQLTGNLTSHRSCIWLQLKVVLLRMLSGWCCYSEAQWLCRYPKHELASGRAFRSSARMCLSVTNLAATKGAWRRFFNCRRRLWFYLLWRSRCMPRPMRSLMSSAVCKCLRHEILFCFSQSLYIDSVRTWLVSFFYLLEKSQLSSGELLGSAFSKIRKDVQSSSLGGWCFHLTAAWKLFLSCAFFLTEF